MGDIERGRNINFAQKATVTRVEINSVTPTVIANPNQERMYFSVTLEPGSSNVDAYIRPYPAAQDNFKHGEVLTRRLSGNDSLFRPNWTMQVDTPVYGEISAISENGTFDVIVVEY